MYLYTCTYAHTHTHVHTNTPKETHTHIHTRQYTQTHTHSKTDSNTNIHTHVQTHTHTYTHIITSWLGSNVNIMSNHYHNCNNSNMSASVFYHIVEYGRKKSARTVLTAVIMRKRTTLWPIPLSGFFTTFFTSSCEAKWWTYQWFKASIWVLRSENLTTTPLIILQAKERLLFLNLLLSRSDLKA